MRLKAFDAQAKCPKCGNDDIATHYHAAGDSRPLDDCWHTDIAEREHHDRHCRRCSYEWHEGMLDHRLEVK